MEKAKEDLKAILDLLAEWRAEYGVGYITVHILHDGYGSAYTFDKTGQDVDVSGTYENKETPAAETAGESCN